jgi:hypothetical protein
MSLKQLPSYCLLLSGGPRPSGDERSVTEPRDEPSD